MIENPINRYVCECVRLGRIDRGLSMRETAERAGIPLGTYSCLESSQYRMSLENLFRILSVLGMDIRAAWPGGAEPSPMERVTPDFIRESVARSRRERPPRADLDDILSVVCELYGFKPEELADRSRLRERSEARSMAACLMRLHRHLSVVRLAQRLGRDPSSLYSGRERLEARMESDRTLKARLKRAEALLQRRMNFKSKERPAQDRTERRGRGDHSPR